MIIQTALTQKFQTLFVIFLIEKTYLFKLNLGFRNFEITHCELIGKLSKKFDRFADFTGFGSFES